MFINIIITLLIFLLMCTFFDCKADTNQPNWLKGLTRYIEQDTSTHQTLLIINEDVFRKKEKVETIVREIKRFKPSINFLVRNETIQEDIDHWKLMEAFDFPRSTFQIIIDSLRNDLNIAKEVIQMMNILLNGRSHQKCLVLQFADGHKSLNLTKKQLLQTAWKNQFLDFSILKIDGNTTKVQYYNPFTHIYSTKKYTSRTQLFPDKLRNMNYHQLRVGVPNLPPRVYIEYNSSGYPISYSGSDIHLVNAFARKMNFIPKFNAGVGEKEKPEVFFMQQLLQHKMQICLARVSMQKVGNNSLLQFLETGFGSMNALIPKTQNQKELSALPFLQALSPIAVFSALLWLLIYVLKLFSNDWNLSFTVQVVLGLTVPQEPQNWKARIIFAYMVIVSFIYSSKIYAMLTSINVESTPELELRTLAELDKSGLKLELNPVFIDAMSKDVQNLGLVRRYQNKFFSVEECVRHVIAEKNVSCLMSKTSANWYQLRFMDEDGNSLTEVVQEPFITSIQGFYLEAGSPYVERFHSLFLRLMTSGILDKWNKDDVFQVALPEKNKEALGDMKISNNVLLGVLVTELLLGFLISGIVFFVEIVKTIATRAYRRRL